MDTHIAIAPKCTRHHKVVQQGKATYVGVRLLEYVDAGMSRSLLAPRAGALVEMNGESAYRLGEDAYTRPYCREVESTLLG